MTVDELAADFARAISRLLYGTDDAVEPDSSILDDGTLSSINMIEIVADIEDRFGALIPADALYGPAFASPRALAAFVLGLVEEAAR